jgi:hypothetical protein
MERVAFLIEKTGERLGCMLNPETLVLRRVAGVKTRQTSGGPLTGAGLKNDPLLYTGGGMTELILDLLFDLNLAGSSIQSEDVRGLTRPLFELAEGLAGADGSSELPLVRFVWGKYWNILGVVASVAERLEQFTAGGAAQRSWLRMRLLCVTEETEGEEDFAHSAPIPELPEDFGVPPEDVQVHEVLGGGPAEMEEGAVEPESADDEPPGSTERLDEIAHRAYGDSRYWRIIADFNDIDSPLELGAGRLLRLPPRAAVEEA